MKKINYHDEIIKKSHERSNEYGIEINRVYPKKILSKEEIPILIKRNRDLIRIASPFMKILYDFLEGSGFFIVLTDNEGCILSTIGDKDIILAAKEMNLDVGAYMNENSIGTNAMGTAIKEDMPIQISAKEHFITAYHRWTCSAAPIHNIKGEIIGTLNLTGNSNLVHPHTLGLVVAAVRSIENQIKSDEANNRLIETYSYLNTIIESINFGIIAVDKDGLIKNINGAACSMFNCSKDYLNEQHVQRILPSWNEIEMKIKSGNKIVDEEIHFKINGKSQKYIINIHPIKDEKDSLLGTVISFKNMQNVYNLINKYTGMKARYTFEDIIYKSSSMGKIIEYSKSIADSPSTVLITGESGTGKEILAQAIHNSSSRKDNGFVAINCGAIPQNLIESELFGYDEGAFTGAKKGGNPGKFELANGGTLFLDEIGEMTPDMQVKLLRALQEGCITRIGGSKYIEVDVRIIAATNRNLLSEVQRGNFREDLYYRISVIPILLPPLRERREDIPLLIEHFLELKSLKLKKPIPKLNQLLYDKILSYNWWGNIRELENFIESAVNFNGNTEFLMNKFQDLNEIKEDKVYERNTLSDEFIGPLEELERRAIINCLKKYENNITKCSKILNISRNTLYLKMKKYNIDL
ncbi:PAS domain S-box-containing protein [Caloramator quimbayensis]|uniref:PAS domain S-box-containing protein n=1 Tax=Caloramator quimbayensis TaxID=1147123 RepID=A0A1T4Y0Z1_9CLOT|nr:sigma 54-interacting transcriptional regulator [Caloramator quimbayensis]SKA95459.1 PAS domain S-box-containing protein [Caloramator quimbayensis]